MDQKSETSKRAIPPTSTSQKPLDSKNPTTDSKTTVDKTQLGSEPPKETKLKPDLGISRVPSVSRLATGESPLLGEDERLVSTRRHRSVTLGQLPELSDFDRHRLEHHGRIGKGGAGEIHKVRFQTFYTD